MKTYTIPAKKEKQYPALELGDRPRPKMMDLYCGGGLAAIGYHQAGFDVYGLDIKSHPNYPFSFFQGNVLSFLENILSQPNYLNHFRTEYSLVHASPPCQKYSQSTALQRKKGKVYPDLVAPTRELLEKIGLPYIIENVPGAPIRKDIVLRGDMFGLHVRRRRWFELGNWYMMQPGLPNKKGSLANGDFVSVFGKGSYRVSSKSPSGFRPKCDQGSILKTWHFAMGIPPEFGPFNYRELAEGIPPSYTKYIGEHFMAMLKITNP